MTITILLAWDSVDRWYFLSFVFYFTLLLKNPVNIEFMLVCAVFFRWDIMFNTITCHLRRWCHNCGTVVICFMLKNFQDHFNVTFICKKNNNNKRAKSLSFLENQPCDIKVPIVKETPTCYTLPCEHSYLLSHTYMTKQECDLRQKV